MSGKSQEPKVFYVEGDGITSAGASNVGNELTIQLEVAIFDPRNANNAKMKVGFSVPPTNRKNWFSSTSPIEDKKCTVGVTNGADLKEGEGY